MEAMRNALTALMTIDRYERRATARRGSGPNLPALLNNGSSRSLCMSSNSGHIGLRMPETVR